MIQVGCCTFNWGWLELDSALHVARDLGFSVVDVGCTGPNSQINQSAAPADPSNWGLELRGASRRMGLTLSELFVCQVDVDGQQVSPNEPDEALSARALRVFRGLCQFAVEAGFVSIMVVPGRPVVALPDGGWALSVERLTRMAAMASEYGIQLNVEPHAESIVEMPERAIALAKQVSGLGFTLDYAHHMGLGIPQEEVAPLHAYARHLHAKPARPGWSKCAWHNNAIDFAAIIADLRARDWEGVISVETIGAVEDGRPTYVERPPEGADVVPLTGLAASPITQTALVGQAIERLLANQ